jgi:hypothetical protein
MEFTEVTKFHRKSGREPRPALRSAIDREYIQLTQQETAEPEENQDRFRSVHGDNTGSNPVGDVPSRDGGGLDAVKYHGVPPCRETRVYVARVSFIIRDDAVHGYNSHDEVWSCVVSM